jgi:hypothetical protein
MGRVQKSLFPHLDECFDTPPTEQEKRLVSISTSLSCGFSRFLVIATNSVILFQNFDIIVMTLLVGFPTQHLNSSTYKIPRLALKKYFCRVLISERILTVQPS